MSEGALEQIAATADNSLASYISISIPPILDTLSAVVLAFVLGLCMSTLRGKTIGDTLYNGMKTSPASSIRCCTASSSRCCPCTSAVPSST